MRMGTGEAGESMDQLPPPSLRTQADVTERLEHIQSERQHLQDVLRALDVEEARMRKLWNSFLPVNKLPNELLVSIFQLSTSDWELISRLRGDMKWVRLMLVCSYWREVACATPSLWRNIGITGDVPDWLNLCLARSAETSLHISLSKPSLEMVRTVATQGERVETLDLYHPENPRSLSPVLLQRPMPILHDLVISVKDRGPRVNLQMLPTHYPALSSLRLSHVEVPSNIHLYAGLRKLSLSNCGYGSSATLSQFLAALRASPHLESLTVTNVLEGLTRGDDSGLLPVTLPHLSDFHLSNNWPSYGIPFLMHLRIPPTCTATIFATPHTENFALAPLDQTIAALLPENVSEVLPLMSSVTALELEMTWGDYTIRGVPPGSDGFQGTVLLGLVAEGQPVEDWSDQLSSGLRELAQVFEGSPVTRVRVDADHRSSYLPEAWCEVFRAFPLLETLELTGTGSPSRMWMGLRTAEPTVVQYPGEGLPPVACPRLRTVTVDGMEMLVSQRFFGELLSCLRRRSRQGARLESLYLKLSADQAHSDKLRHRYLAQVEELVGRVSYALYER